MSANKKLLIKSIIMSIICISVFTIVLDLSRLFGPNHLSKTFNNDFIKRINVILAALLVWLTGKDSLDRRDAARMKFAFIAIGCAEVLFLLAKPAYAIGFFIVCQCILVFRHCTGLNSKLKRADFAQKLKLALIFFTLNILLFSVVIISYTMVDSSTLIFMGALYGLVLNISLWVGIANFVLSLFPDKNSKIIAIAMVFFYLGDILVGLDGLLSSGPIWLIATSLIWVFYTPAITLLAISSYKL
ncbi:MAG: YhhN-like protein [Clostridia bacterium]|jgi:hypothetical protein|nr:YhhN-like protein [Clostridia bacterium]